MRARAERLGSKAFLFSISPWEEVLPGDPTVSHQFLATKAVPSKLCGRGTTEHSQDRQAGIPDLCRQLLPKPWLVRSLLDTMCWSASSHWASLGELWEGEGHLRGHWVLNTPPE